VAEASPIPRLTDIVEAIDHIRSETADISLDAFERDWRKQWLVERGVEIISEASRHLPDDLKARHSKIPWRKVAGIGNVLRHDYESIAAQIMWALVRDDLPRWTRSAAMSLPQPRRASRNDPVSGSRGMPSYGRGLEAPDPPEFFREWIAKAPPLPGVQGAAPPAAAQRLGVQPLAGPPLFLSRYIP
jgi:uncharacterized protein with HEPN domain